LLLPAVSAFSLTGCWDRFEPNVLGVVSIAAFDMEPESGLLRVYAQLANPLGGGGQQDGGGGGGGGAQGSSPIWVVESMGHTVREAIKNMELISTRKLLWTHVEVVLFSEELAREGLRPVLDYIDREHQLRPISRPFVVQGDLRRLLEAQFPLEQVGGTAISKQFFSVRGETSFIPDVESIVMLLRHLSQPGLELILPRLVVLAEEGEKEGNPAGKTNPVRISGAGVFRGDKLVGFLDDKETAGYLWLTGKITRRALVLKCPGSEGDFLTVDVYEAAVKLRPEIKGDEVRFKVSVTAGGRILDFACPDFPSRREFISSLNRRMAAAIRQEIADSLEKARELESDIFGLGNIIYRTRNGDWRRLGRRWQEIFPRVAVDIEVEAKVLEHGLVSKPIQIQ
jgi:spore germination protein KC